MINIIQSKFQKAGIVSMLAFCSFGTLCAQQELAKVNSIYDEQHPVLSSNGDLYFTKGLHPANVGGERDLGDLWVSPNIGESSWGESMHLKSISTSGNDVVVGFLSEDKMLVYHDGKEKKQGIHQYSKNGGSWTYEKLLKIESFRNNSTHFSGRLSTDGKAIIMTLESYGSYGNEDIYISFAQNDGSWSSPQNLGPNINTYKQEMTPSLSSDGLTLYFSSNGHGTSGGRNILYAQRLDNSWENWSKPIPLSEINSPGVELAYIELGDRAMFTSTQNSEGFGDILLTAKIEIVQAKPIEETILAEEVINETIEAEQVQELRNPPHTEITEPIRPSDPPAKIPEEIKEGKVIAKALEEEKPASVEGNTIDLADIVVLDINTLEEVNYSATLIGEKDNYRQLTDINSSSDNADIRISAKGYFPQIFAINQLRTLEEPIYLTPVLKGTSIVLEDIYFKKGTSDLADQTSPNNLNKIADFLKENPEVKIRLEGHTDNLGDPQLNKELSMNRASQIRKYLVDRGIEFERVRVSGWGGSKPVANNQTEEGRNKNRRVEMLIEE